MTCNQHKEINYVFLGHNLYFVSREGINWFLVIRDFDDDFYGYKIYTNCNNYSFTNIVINIKAYL
jgi:hypothetical protein